MIQNKKQKMERDQGLPFLIWGYTTILISIAVWYLLKTTGNNQWNILWLAIPVISLPIMLLLKYKKPKHVTTYIDNVISQIWLVFGISPFLLVFSAAIFNVQLPFLFVISLLMGMGTAITGLVIKFNPCIWSGFFAMATAQFCLMKDNYSVLVFGVIFFIMMIIPGHILNHKARKQCLKN